MCVCVCVSPKIISTSVATVAWPSVAYAAAEEEDVVGPYPSDGTGDVCVAVLFCVGTKFRQEGEARRKWWGVGTWRTQWGRR